MPSKRTLERQLAGLAGFEEPRVELEQYATPAELAAHVVHLADLQGDLARTVVDLGSGTGVLALGAALRTTSRVVAVERDRAAIATARENERRLDGAPVTWLRADATRAPLCLSNTTVLMNPPFGAQRGQEHADRAFLETAARIGRASYSIHNAGSRDFVEAFADDAGGDVTHAFEAELAVVRQFDFHTEEAADVPVEVYRIEWRQRADRESLRDRPQ